LNKTGTPARLRILVAAPWVYHPHCGIGGGVLCFRVLEALAERFDFHWLSWDVTAHGLAEGKAALGAVCRSVTTVPPPAQGSKYMRRMRELLGDAPSEIQKLRTSGMRAALERVRTEHQIDIVWLQFPQMAHLIPAAAPAAVVMDVQDACMVSKFRQWRATQGGAQRAKQAMDWLAWTRHELHFYGKADTLLALSEGDLGVLRSFVPETTSAYSPVATVCGPRRLAPSAMSSVVFVGNFTHSPNIDGLQWLLASVWPTVRKFRPDAELLIVGPACPPLSDAERALGVKAVGFVEDLEGLLDGAAASLVPYRFGGGVKIKAVESMARGCPVVATTIGAEGLSVIDGQEALVANSADEFADKIVWCLENPSDAYGLGERGRDHVDRLFSVRAKADGLAALLERTLAVHRSAAR
jgi:polysaccharide biosynthesis protein PslH